MINLYGLKYFLDAARLRSMTKAAEINHLTRPAISLAIQRLEDELGTKLLIHQRRSFELTQAGTQLMKRAEMLLAEAEQLKNDLTEAKETISGTFRIGTTRSLATFNMPMALRKVKAEYPHVDFSISLGTAGALIQRLENREIDFAYIITDESMSDYRSVVLHRGHYALIRPKGTDSKALEYAITERRHETERVKILFERNFSAPLPVFSEVQSWDAIWNWVNGGLCGGLVPDFLFSARGAKKNFSMVIPKVYPYEIKAMFGKNKASHPIIKSFLGHLN